MTTKMTNAPVTETETITDAKATTFHALLGELPHIDGVSFVADWDDFSFVLDFGGDADVEVSIYDDGGVYAGADYADADEFMDAVRCPPRNWTETCDDRVNGWRASL